MLMNKHKAETNKRIVEVHKNYKWWCLCSVLG